WARPASRRATSSCHGSHERGASLLGARHSSAAHESERHWSGALPAMMGVWLEELTWPEAKARFDSDAVVVIPIGAASKAHGAHLPLKTDALTARALAQRLVDRLPVVAAPVVGFGYYPAFTSFAGSQHLGADTFKALMGDLLAGLRTHGVRRIAVVNTGV